MLPEKVMTAETYVETLSFGKKGDFEHVLQRLQKPGSVKDLFYTIGLAAARAALSAVDAFRRSGAVGLTDGTVWSHISVICGKASARAQSIEARTSSYHFGTGLRRRSSCVASPSPGDGRGVLRGHSAFLESAWSASRIVKRARSRSNASAD
ncbi:RHTO0S16e01046g2_1 [Rhodotorula toruloides]|uniref:RHTO0S16e01046g2_1 n=1 Tax=Rhodotorula toruloides TaxID=5286 RepID=A0A061BDT5_RHOTO|nr:RHTO0S16e01046g2_1 [Rhodotorula toruloides]